MTENYIVETRLSKTLEAIHAARRDFDIAKQMIEGVLEVDAVDINSNLEEAAWTTAVIRYTRGWKLLGYPASIRAEVLRNLNDSQRDVHAQILTIRDAMYAHHLGVGTGYSVTAKVGPDSTGLPQLWGVGIQSHRVASPGLDDAARFLELLTITSRVFLAHENRTSELLWVELLALDPSEWIRLGPYKPELNYGESSRIYRREKRKRTPKE
ncbi:hypothetical protein [Arenimonas sp. SCN 70-307]|uniref:hypothetical protein n=1 Tax=Arenimonas sp. SCN 70-307 TaxID=1660089 RepID=UPI0025C0DD00|nr:hypothetical protein [Arenimonas sp. SCN 70-307]